MLDFLVLCEAYILAYDMEMMKVSRAARVEADEENQTRSEEFEEIVHATDPKVALIEPPTASTTHSNAQTGSNASSVSAKRSR